MPEKQQIGILHPGAMGVSLAASVIASGHNAFWISKGRSHQTHARAKEHGLIDCSSLSEMSKYCEMIVSICPPAAADEVADQVIDSGFSGVFVDANAISPMRASSIAERVNSSGARYVDGGVIGGPAWTKGETMLYLSGPEANRAASAFCGGLVETRVIGDQTDQASALKMCYAALTKGTTAMLCAVIGAAHALGVDEELRSQWDMDELGSAEQRYMRLCRVTKKAWRFEGEMREIAQTLKSAGMPSGFHEAAEDVYAHLNKFRGRDSLPAAEEVLEALLKQS